MLSTFTTQIGKIRYRRGWFGWHSFPAIFQTLIMERVVLPTRDELEAAILAWIDDILIAAETIEQLTTAIVAVLKRLEQLGARVSLDKTTFLAQKADWCGVLVDLQTQTFKIAPERISSMREELVAPTDVERSFNTCWAMKYYYCCVKNIR